MEVKQWRRLEESPQFPTVKARRISSPGGKLASATGNDEVERGGVKKRRGEEEQMRIRYVAHGSRVPV